jgi:tetratricopeptide (TPR) repeat protein
MRFAQRAAEQGTLVWWVPAGDQASVSACLREVATRLDGDSARVAHAWSGDRSAPDVLWQLLEATRQRWILVFDNVEDSTVLNPATGNHLDGTGWLRTPPSTGMLLLTSRNGDPGQWGNWVTIHRLRPLPPCDGAQVLLDYATDRAGTAAQAAELSARLGGLPLALRAAGSYILTVSQSPEWLPEHQPITFPSYLTALNERFSAPDREDVTENLGLEIVHQAAELSLQLLSATDQHIARLLLELFSQLADAAIPYAKILRADAVRADPLFAAVSIDQLRSVVNTLAALSLIDIQTVPEVNEPGMSRVLTIHPIIRDIARLRRTHDLESIVFLGLRAVHAVAAELDPEAPQDWPAWQLIAPHCNHQIYSSTTQIPHLPAQRRDETDEIAIRLGLLSSRYLDSIGLYQQAERVLLTLLTQRGVADSAHPVALAVRHELTRCYAWQGRWPAAEQECRSVLSARRRALGRLHPDTLATWHNLAAILAGRQSSLRDAEREYRSVLKARESVLGTEHPDYLNSFHGLAYTLGEQGRWQSAEAAYQVVMRSRTAILGPDHPATLWTRHELASCADEQGRWAQAQDMFLTVSERRRAVLGEAHPDTLISRGELAGVLGKLGDIEGARSTYHEVLGLQLQVLGDRHPDTLATKHNLAWLLSLEQRWEEAERASELVLQARRRELGGQDRDTLVSAHNLAVAIGRQGRLDESRELLWTTWTRRTELLGSEHPETLTTEHELATLKAEQGQHAEAMNEYQIVLKKQTRVLGKDHPDTELTRANIRALTIEQTGVSPGPG